MHGASQKRTRLHEFWTVAVLNPSSKFFSQVNFSFRMAHDSQFPRTTIKTTTAPMMTPVMLNKRTRLLQYLQTSDGHHGIPAM